MTFGVRAYSRNHGRISSRNIAIKKRLGRQGVLAAPWCPQPNSGRWMAGAAVVQACIDAAVPMPAAALVHDADLSLPYLGDVARLENAWVEASSATRRDIPGLTVLVEM